MNIPAAATYLEKKWHGSYSQNVAQHLVKLTRIWSHLIAFVQVSGDGYFSLAGFFLMHIIVHKNCLNCQYKYKLFIDFVEPIV